jgi:hypothetical protein
MDYVPTTLKAVLDAIPVGTLVDYPFAVAVLAGVRALLPPRSKSGPRCHRMKARPFPPPLCLWCRLVVAYWTSGGPGLFTWTSS